MTNLKWTLKYMVNTYFTIMVVPAGSHKNIFINI